MNALQQITEKILNQLPPETLLTEEDINILKQHEPFFRKNIDALTQDFYDILFSYPPTTEVFQEGERKIREKSFKEWVFKTINGNFEDKYWQWQTFVGILHVKRNIRNNVMISMMGRVNDIVITAALQQLPLEDALALKSAWLKLASMVLSLISESYHFFYLKAISEATGLPVKLFDNAVKIEIDNLVERFQEVRNN